MKRERIGHRNSRRRLFVQSLEKRNLLAGDVGMTNASNPLDVNGDTAVSPADALGVINTLARMQSGAEGESISSESGMMPDTNGDGLVTPSDALGVINALEAEGEWTGGAPDIIVESETLELLNPASNARLSITFDIRFEGDPNTRVFSGSINGGLTDASGMVVREFELQGSSGTDFSFDSMNPNRVIQAIESISLANLDDGDYGLSLTATSSFVNDQNQSNNTLDRDVVLRVSNGSPSLVDSTNDTPVVSIQASADQITEGNVVRFTASRTGDASSALEVGYSTSGSTTEPDFSSVVPESFALGSGTIRFEPGQSTVEVAVTFESDDVTEGSETLSVTLDPGAGVSTTSGSASVTVNDPGTLPPENPMNGTVRKFEVRQGSTTVIEFEGDNVRGEVTVMSDGTVRLVGGGINETLALEAPENIRLRVVGHHNTLIVRGVEIRNDVIIDVDGNQNHFALIDSRIGDDLIYLGAEGVDRVLLDNTHIGDSFQFHGRKLDDALVMRNNTRIGGDFIYHGHRGHDLLYADGVSIGDDAIVRMGDGDDVGAVRNVVVNDVANLHAQGDFDLAAIGGSNFDARRLIQNGFEGEISFNEVESIVNTYIDQILGSPTT